MKLKMSLALTLTFMLTGAFSFSGNTINTTHIYANQKIINNPNKAFQEYVSLQKALAQDNSDGAQKAATKLVIALKDIPGSIEATKAASIISQSKDIEVQRKSFATLSLDIERLFKVHKPGHVIYVQYCPMKRVYWLSGSKKILNPYFGKAMPSCGETKEVIR